MEKHLLWCNKVNGQYIKVNSINKETFNINYKLQKLKLYINNLESNKISNIRFSEKDK